MNVYLNENVAQVPVNMLLTPKKQATFTLASVLFYFV